MKLHRDIRHINARQVAAALLWLESFTLSLGYEHYDARLPLSLTFQGVSLTRESAS